MFGTENMVANLDQIQSNLNLIQDHQSQITVNRITTDTNAKNIAQNKTAIDDNTHEIDTNAQLIRATAKQVGDNRDGVAVNKAGIKTNADAIAQNKTTLDDHALAIHNLDGHLQSVDDLAHDLNIKNIQDRAELAQHDQAIKNNAAENTHQDVLIQGNSQTGKTNGDNIALNKAGIKTNADAIAQNKTAIGDNTHEIDTNAQLIRSTEKQVGENRTGLLANKGDIVTTATGVLSNAADIATNKTSIDRLSGQNGTTFKLAAATARLSIHEEQQIVSLAQDTKVAQTTGEYAQSRAQMALDNAEKNRAALVASNKKIAANSAALADHEQRIETLEQSNSSNFGKLKSEVEDNRKRASAGIAGVAAMANIPQVTNTQNFSVGAGVGNTDGENALAVGFSARATKNVVVKASVSNDTQHNFVVGGGIAYGW
ncbi:TPA: YadA C-terminal domain-containing protein [Enterobacter asburiae]